MKFYLCSIRGSNPLDTSSEEYPFSAMDEVLFLLSQRIETLQIYLRSGFCTARRVFLDLTQQLQDSASRVSSGHVVIMREKLQVLWDVIRAFIFRLKHLTVHFSLRDAYRRFFVFLSTEVTRASLYVGCIGFLLGGSIGVMVGLSLQHVPAVPHRMRAVVTNSYQGLDAVSVVEDVPAPKIMAANEVLIQVKAAAVDKIDIKICSGYGRVLRKHLNKYNRHMKSEFPVVLGRDCAGIVVEIGYGVRNLEVGDEVWLSVPYWTQGVMSEFVVTKECEVVKKPKRIGFEGAACIPYSALVAWDALVNQAGLGPLTTKGKRVLIHAGGESISCLAIQLIKLWGGHVTTTVSIRAVPLVQMLGADDIIMYSETNFEKELEIRDRFDVVLNTIGSVLHNSCLGFCKPDGIVVTTVASPIASDTHGFLLGTLYALWIRIKFIAQKVFLRSDSWGTVQMSHTTLDYFHRLIDEGSLQPVVDKAYSAPDAELAFQHVAKGDPVGKTVIRFRSRPLASRAEGAL